MWELKGRGLLRVAGLPPCLIFPEDDHAAMLVELLADYPALAVGKRPASDDEAGHLHAPPLFVAADTKDAVGGPLVIPQMVRDVLVGADPKFTPSVRSTCRGRPAPQRCPKPIPLRKGVDDPGSGSILHVAVQVACPIHELGEHLDRTDQMEEELLDQLLAVVEIGTREIPTVERNELLLPPPTGGAKPLSNLFGSQRWMCHRARRPIASAGQSASNRVPAGASPAASS